MLDLIDTILDHTQNGQPVAACLLSKTTGSTPQKPGALMLVLPTGQTLGTIGGGCVEAEVKTRGLQTLLDNNSSNNQTPTATPTLMSFKLNQDYGWDDGLVCGGQMQVAVQIIQPQSPALQIWANLQRQLMALQSATLKFTAIDEDNQPVTIQHTLHPKPTLIIAGAGHVGTELGKLAPAIDFNLTIIDDRPDYANANRFPNANATCFVGPIDQTLTELDQQNQLNDHSYIVIVTRGHKHDGDALAAVARSQAKYIGLIGSRRKIISIYETLKDDGVTPDQLARIHAPIGLRIGAVEPGEIAISIAGQLIAIRRNQPVPQDVMMKLEPKYLNPTE